MSTPTTTLPIEIWEIILAGLTALICPSLDVCTSLDYPKLIYDWARFRDLNLKQVNHSILNLRLVCRLWASIIDSKRASYVVATKLTDVLAYTTVRTLIMDENKGWTGEDVPTTLLTDKLFDNTRTITTVIIHIIEDGWSSPEFILDNSILFPQLRSIALTSYDQVPVTFWRRLPASFPLLTALSLDCTVDLEEEITLHHLEILVLHMRTIPRFHLPSLKHLTLDAFASFELLERIADDCGDRLESILVPTRIYGIPNWMINDFWTRFPKLQLFGARSVVLNKLPTVPPSHPFRHLRLFDPTPLNLKALLPRITGQNVSRLRYVSTSAWEWLGFQLKNIDPILREFGMTGLQMNIYGTEVWRDIHEPSVEKPWKTVTHSPHYRSAAAFCIWEYVGIKK